MEGSTVGFGSDSESGEFRLPPGGIVGIIGPNGAGKTTLFKIISGEEKADSGELRRIGKISSVFRTSDKYSSDN
jgi:ABC-type multidrug transport system ATPase subunit